MARRKTWSQESLAVKRQIAGDLLNPSGLTALFSSDRRSMMLLALKTAVAAGLCYWLATLVHLQDGYWGSISAIIVLQSNVGLTVGASRDRLIGTLVGAAYGAAFSFFNTSIWSYLFAVVTAMITCGLIGLKNSARLAGVTITIVMLVHKTAPGSGWDWTLPMRRVIEVLFGIVVALGMSALVLPNRAKSRLQDGLAQEYLVLGALFNEIIKGFGASISPTLNRVKSELNALTASNEQLRDAARNEPSGGPATLEGLRSLERYGRALQEILHALELAVEGSGDDFYAARLDPELGKLVVDVHRGFEYVGGCIHRWRFDIAPEQLYLEQDIEDLEKKMDSIRPSGSDFPQAEVLRAYAVQLHLKQLARLLKASRVETGRMLSESR